MRMHPISAELYQQWRGHRMFSPLRPRNKLLGSLSSSKKKRNRTNWKFTCKLQQKRLRSFWRTLSKINSMTSLDPLRKRSMNYLAGILRRPLSPLPPTTIRWRIKQLLHQSHLLISMMISSWRHATLASGIEWPKRSWVWLTWTHKRGPSLRNT